MKRFLLLALFLLIYTLGHTQGRLFPIDDPIGGSGYYYRDADGDGYGAFNSLPRIFPAPGYVNNRDDCNDNNAALPHNNWFRDADGDGYGNSSVRYPFVSCSAPSGYVGNAQDCNDGNSSINPSRPDVCDGIDNNCNGSIDESRPSLPYSISVSYNCMNTVLRRSSPPSGVTWYWQSSSSGTSTGNSSVSITRTSGSVYYLRGRNNSTLCWGPSRSVSYTIGSASSAPSPVNVINNCGSSVLKRSLTIPAGFTWYWQSSSNGTSTANSSSSIVLTSGSVYYLRARNNATGCWSLPRSVSYTIKPSPAQPSSVSFTNNCGNTVLTRGNPPSGVTWYWQSSSSGTSTSNSAVSVTRTAPAPYYLRGRNNSSGCWGPSRILLYDITPLPPIPAAPTVSDICGAVLIKRGTPLTGITWYWQSDASGTSTSNTSSSYVATTGSRVYLRARNNLTSCWGTARTVNYTIKPNPSTPTAPTVTNNCGSVTLTRTNPPSGVTWYWQNGIGQTTTTNSNSSVTLTSGSTYYLRGRNNSTGCWGSDRIINYSITPAPAQPSSVMFTNNCGNTVLTRGNPPSGVTWYWQSSSSGTNTANSSVSVTRTAPAPYYLRGRNNSSGCWGPSRILLYDITPLPAIPAAPSVSNICGAVLIERGPHPIEQTYYWQSTATGISTANSSLSWVVTTGTSVYLRALDNNTLCWSPARVITYTIQPNPARPAAPTVTNNCGSSTLTRGNPPAGITWYWQNALGGRSTSNSNVSITLISGDTYYLRGRNNSTGCWGSDRIVSYSIKDKPAPPPQVNVVNNCGSTVLVRSFAPPSGVTWYWQSSSTGTSTSNSSPSITLNSGTSYYLRARSNSNSCWSAARGVNYTVNPVPTWYRDVDGDGFAVSSVTQCNNPGTGYVLTVIPLTDCDDTNAAINPNTIWYSDVDNDGFGNPNVSTIQCQQPTGYVLNGDDLCPEEAGPHTGCKDTLYDDITLGDENYVYTRMYQSPLKSSGEIRFNKDVIESVTYFDGIGRQKQQIGIKAAPDQGDMITHIDYDDYGRQAQQYLPFNSSENVGSYRQVDVNNDINAYYLSKFPDDFPGVSTSSEVNAYAESIYEASPLNRVLEKASPGKLWMANDVSGANDSDHTIKSDWQTNGTFEVRYFTVGFKNDNTEYPELVSDDFYAVNQLHKTIIKDENWQPGQGFAKEHTVEEFTNKSGQLILKRTYDKNQPLDTYYVYDDFGNLTFVLPPLVDGDEVITESNFSDHSGFYPYSTFVTTDNGGTGGLQVTVIDDMLTMDFDATFNSTTLKEGEVVLINVSPRLPDMQIDNLDATNAGDAYNVSISNGWLKLSRNWGSFPITGFNESFQVDLSTIPGYSTLDKLCYQYRYDNRNRLIEKKVPGKGWEYIVYNKLDQPVLSQDAIQREKDEWLFTKYDAFGRVVYTGVYRDGNTREGMQEMAYDETDVLFESRLDNPMDIDGASVYYTNNAFPFENGTLELYTVNYYDDYELPTLVSFNPANGSGTWQGMTATGDVKGLETVSQSKVLDTDQWITSAVYYDEKGRAWETYAKNDYLGTEDWFLSELDFAGKILQTKALHIKDGTTITTDDFFTYDHVGRLMEHSQSINGGETEVISQNTYDEIGQLEQMGLGNLASEERMQNVDYEYNVRGWLTDINDIADPADDFFNFHIGYAETSQPLFNGNISTTSWNSETSSDLKSYTYTYDGLNRITNAIDNRGKFDLQSVTYDRQGNIKSLMRKGQADAQGNTGVMDQLLYTYGHNSNKLLKVMDSGNDDYGFKEGTNVGDDYTYDANGNMMVDGNKGITNIIYNHLNLPVKIEFEEADNKIEYTYDANGAKLQKKVIENGSINTTTYAGNFVYKNDELKFLFHTEGFVEPTQDTSNPWEYLYYLKDHLGNNRIVFTSSPKTLEFKATMETEQSSAEETLFSNLPETRVTFPSAAHSPTKVAKLTPQKPIGPALSLPVREGDVISMDSYAYFEGGSGYSNTTSLASFIASVAGAFGGVNGGNELQQSTFNAFDNAYGIMGLQGSGNDNVPAAYLNYILFDKNMTYKTSGFKQISTAGRFNKEHVVFDDIEIDESGFVYCFVSMENSSGEVYWDDFNVEIKQYPVREVTDYYPFGLEQGNSDDLMSEGKHNYGFNGIELEEGLGVDLYEMDLRHYDPSIARWTGIDPVTHHSMSPYTAFDNNPVFWADPSGGNGECNTCGSATDIMGRDRYDENGMYIPPHQRQDNGGYLANQESKKQGRKATRNLIYFTHNSDNNTFTVTQVEQFLYSIENGKDQVVDLLIQYETKMVISSELNNGVLDVDYEMTRTRTSSKRTSDKSFFGIFLTNINSIDNFDNGDFSDVPISNMQLSEEMRSLRDVINFGIKNDRNFKGYEFWLNDSQAASVTAVATLGNFTLSKKIPLLKYATLGALIGNTIRHQTKKGIAPMIILSPDGHLKWTPLDSKALSNLKY